MGWTREEADRILMACHEADSALFGPAFVTLNSEDAYIIRLNGTDDDACRANKIVARAAVLTGVADGKKGVIVSRDGKTIARHLFVGEEVA